MVAAAIFSGAAAADCGRADLFYRLHVFPLRVPPLRERGADILLLAGHFLARCARKLGRDFAGLGRESRERLLGYSWPGNVRDLANVIERAAIMSPGPLVSAQLPPPSSAPVDPTAAPLVQGGDSLRAVEAAHIARVLRDCGWVIEGPRGAARSLGMEPSTLRHRMRKLGLARPRD